MPDSSQYMENADAYRKANPLLTDNDIKSYNINKGVWFNSTIAVCVVYGTIAIGMLLIVLFSPSGSQFLTDDFRAFSLTFIGGIILVIILLVVQILSFKPRVYLAPPFDNDMCPDYWTLKQNTDTLTAAEKLTTQYYCEPPIGYTSITPVPTFTSSHITTPNTTNDGLTYPATNILYTSSSSYYPHYNGTPGTSNLDCSKVYPYQLSMLNNHSTTLTEPNALQCAYAQQCGITWTSMCPTVPTNQI